MGIRFTGPGQRFGRLTVLHEVPGRHHRCWLCRCACGARHVVSQPNLISGATNSCGCLLSERTIERNTTHGAAGIGRRAPEYAVWISIKGRCCNPRNRAFPGYGERGITVCERWAESYEAFISDMGPRPSRRHSVERKNNDGPYSPDNCIWATRSVQASNTRRNVHVTYSGERMTIAEAARRSGISAGTISQRIRWGWHEADLFKPFEPGKPIRPRAGIPGTGRPPSVFVTYQGERLGISEAARRAGITRYALKDRIDKGLPESGWFKPTSPRNEDKTTCKHGHDLTDPANVILTHRPNGRISRNCRECERRLIREAQRRRRARDRQKASQAAAE